MKGWMVGWYAVRLGVHLAVGMLRVALQFPGLASTARERAIRRWSSQLAKICGVRIVYDHSLQAEPVSPALIICNHVSWLDIFVLNSLQPCRFVAKSDIRSWPLIGWLCAHSGTIFIARGKPRETRRIYEGLVHSIHEGERVAFFPEGTTAAQGEVLPFHANLFEAAIEAGVPIQPYAIRYIDADGRLHEAANFIGEMSFVESALAIMQCGGMRAELIRLPAIPTQDQHRRDLAVQAHQLVQGALLSRAVDTAGNPPTTIGVQPVSLPTARQ